MLASTSHAVFPFCLCYFQAMQQNLGGQRQLWPDVLRPWLQPVLGEAGGALPLQVPLVLLRDLQEVRSDRGEIRLQMNPCLRSHASSPLHVLSHPRLQINQSTTVPRRLNLVLSFSMCISRRNGLFLCQYHFLYRIFKLPVGLLAFFFFFASQTWMWKAWHQYQSVYVKTAVLLGIFFFLLMIINPQTGRLKVYFYYISIKKK